MLGMSVGGIDINNDLDSDVFIGKKYFLQETSNFIQYLFLISF
jgi:hypothetical protein